MEKISSCSAGIELATLRFIAHDFPSLRHRHYLCYNGETVVIITDRCSYYYWWPAGYRGTPKIFRYTGKILPVASFYSQHSPSAFLVSISGQHLLRHQADIKEDTIARPVCLLKRARVGALSEGNMVEATRVMRKVQPFRVDCTLCFEEWFTDGW